MKKPFHSLIEPAPLGRGFRDDNHWIWCGSVIRDGDGIYQIFASRWSKSLPFTPNWLTNSRVVRAISNSPAGPYRRLLEEPLEWEGKSNTPYEDAFIWHQDDIFHMIFNDMTGSFTGEHHAGAKAIISDGINWELDTNPKAYSRKVVWEDGTTSDQGSFERPQLLLENGVPTHFFAATANGAGWSEGTTHTWNIVVPLQKNIK